MADLPTQITQFDFYSAAHQAGAFVNFAADLITCVIGGFSLYAYLKYRKRFPALIRLLRVQHVNERISEIRRTVDLINSTELVKGRALAVRSQFGRLSGQLTPLCGLLPELSTLHAQIDNIALHNGLLNDAIKQKITHQLIAEIENSKFGDMSDIVRSSTGDR